MRGWRENAILLRRRQRWMTQVVQFVNLEGKRPSLMGAVGIIFLARSRGEQGEQCHQFTSLVALGVLKTLQNTMRSLWGEDGRDVYGTVLRIWGPDYEEENNWSKAALSKGLM